MLIRVAATALCRRLRGAMQLTLFSPCHFSLLQARMPPLMPLIAIYTPYFRFRHAAADTPCYALFSRYAADAAFATMPLMPCRHATMPAPLTAFIHYR